MFQLTAIVASPCSNAEQPCPTSSSVCVDVPGLTSFFRCECQPDWYDMTDMLYYHGADYYFLPSKLPHPGFNCINPPNKDDPG